MAVSSNSTTMPKMDRAAVMRTAWSHYRRAFMRPGHQFPFDRSNFAWCLQCAWQKHREMQLTPREHRIARIEREIELLPFKPLRIDIGAIKRRLETRRAFLAA